MAWPRVKSESQRRKHSAFMRELWRDPEYRVRGVANMRKIGAAQRLPKDRTVKRYGMTAAEYKELKSRPCQVCGARPVHVDHSHKTDKVRGALCGKCNRALGLLGDDIGLILRLADYLAGVETRLTDYMQEESYHHG